MEKFGMFSKSLVYKSPSKFFQPDRLTCLAVLCFVLPALAFNKFSPILFSQLDADKNGILTVSESDKYFESIDTNGDGIIGKTEFSDFFKKVNPDFVYLMDKLYSLIDITKDGLVKKEDFHKAFFRNDLNKDLVVTKSEFLKHFENHTKRHEGKVK